MKKIIALLLLLLGLNAYALTTDIQDNHVRFTTDQITTTFVGSTTQTITSGSLDSFSIQCTWSTVAGTQPVFKLQSSNDESNWDDISGASVTTTLTSGSKTWIVDPYPVKFSRVYVATASTTGNLDCIAIGQRR